MPQTTKTDVREKVEYLEERLNEDFEISHTARGYYLVEAETFNRIGPICQTANQFMIFLRGMDYGEKYS